MNGEQVKDLDEKELAEFKKLPLPKETQQGKDPRAEDNADMIKNALRRRKFSDSAVSLREDRER